jgi:hypothetical protein
LPTSLRQTTFKPGEHRITPDERLLFDPFVKRKHYHHTFVHRVQVFEIE